MVDLGTLGGSQSYAQDINERGLIVGSSDTASGETCAAQGDAATVREP